MTNQSYAHDAVAWAKQRLDDLDTMIAEVEKSSAALKETARKEGEQAKTRLEASRTKLRKYYDDLRSDADAVKRGADKAQKALETEWVEVESAFQAFLSAARDQADTVRGVIAARAEAQRQSWEAALSGLRSQAAEVVDKARGELDGAIKLLSDEADKFQARIGQAKDAGDESWKAVKGGLAEAKAVHDRTIQRIKEAFSKLI